MRPMGRRSVLTGLAAASLACRIGNVVAQDQPGSGQGLLARLQQAKKVRVGVANQPPFSAVGPDGTLTGVAPSVSKAVMKRLGILEFEPSIGTYGELIPGMLAGRWDFVTAALTVTKPRCEQVLFSDPVTLDARAIVSLKGELADPPTRIADLVAKRTVVGIIAGGADLRLMLSVGVDQSNLKQFPQDSALMDGLIAKRVQVAFGSHAALVRISQLRKLDLAITYPIEDDRPTFTACAFRKEDTDLYGAFQKELGALKASGEFQVIVEQNGFEAPPALVRATPVQACAF